MIFHRTITGFKSIWLCVHPLHDVGDCLLDGGTHFLHFICSIHPILVQSHLLFFFFFFLASRRLRSPFSLLTPSLPNLFPYSSLIILSHLHFLLSNSPFPSSYPRLLYQFISIPLPLSLSFFICLSLPSLLPSLSFFTNPFPFPLSSPSPGVSQVLPGGV